MMTSKKKLTGLKPEDYERSHDKKALGALGKALELEMIKSEVNGFAAEEKMLYLALYGAISKLDNLEYILVLMMDFKDIGLKRLWKNQKR